MSIRRVMFAILIIGLLANSALAGNYSCIDAMGAAPYVRDAVSDRARIDRIATLLERNRSAIDTLVAKGVVRQERLAGAYAFEATGSNGRTYEVLATRYGSQHPKHADIFVFRDGKYVEFGGWGGYSGYFYLRFEGGQAYYPRTRRWSK